MANTDISPLSQISGFLGACLVDSETGLIMATEGGDSIDLEAAGASVTEVVKAEAEAMSLMEMDDTVDDILMTLTTQYHLIRPMADTPTVFVYVILDKKIANLGMSRVQIKNVEQGLSFT